MFVLPVSNLGLEADYPEVDPGFFSSPGKFQVNTLSQATATSFHDFSGFFSLFRSLRYWQTSLNNLKIKKHFSPMYITMCPGCVPVQRQAHDQAS
jgi:hypothetical protein